MTFDKIVGGIMGMYQMISVANVVVTGQQCSSANNFKIRTGDLQQVVSFFTPMDAACNHSSCYISVPRPQLSSASRLVLMTDSFGCLPPTNPFPPFVSPSIIAFLVQQFASTTLQLAL